MQYADPPVDSAKRNGLRRVERRFAAAVARQSSAELPALGIVLTLAGCFKHLLKAGNVQTK
jgi:hypothetical protein